MNQPTPAIVAQGAVRRLPRAVLWLFCLAYVLPGFIGRAPWKSADMTALGYMAELAGLTGMATGVPTSHWWAPTLMGLAPKLDGLLPYGFGAWAMQAARWATPDLAARIAFALLLALTLLATWYSTYCLARALKAQPVAFAFGGEARPTDYARTMADGGLLAFIACLGLAQLSHETTPAAAQLCFTALSFYGFAATPYRPASALVCMVAGSLGLVLSGAPTLAVLFGLGGLIEKTLDRNPSSPLTQYDGEPAPAQATLSRSQWLWAISLLLAAMAALASALGLWRWRIALPQASWAEWHGIGRLFLWFLWPAWPLALWTLWRWRLQLFSGQVSRHLLLPLWFVLMSVGDAILTGLGDRALLLALPAMAALAAFALPTLSRGVGALVDWFTLVFFTSCAFVVWVVWIAMQTGFPPQPAANVVRLAPGFSPSFQYLPFLFALAATLAWAWLVRWRVGQHRAAIWKSLVLPAGGAALCWLLLMTLWLPLLDFARSYTLLVQRIGDVVKNPVCVETHGLDRGQIAAFSYQGQLSLQPAGKAASCPWLLVDRDAVKTLPDTVNMSQWTPQYVAFRPSDSDDDVVLYRLRDATAPAVKLPPRVAPIAPVRPVIPVIPVAPIVPPKSK